MPSTLPQDILIGARGWNHTSWQGSFYPDDLPEDWRLSYYANEFTTVLVPESEWIDSDKDDIEQWLNDTDEEFVFFFEIGFNVLASQAGQEKLALLNQMKNQAGGLLITGINEKPSAALPDLRNKLSFTLPINIDFHDSQLDITTQQSILKALNADPCWHTLQTTETKPLLFKHMNFGLIDSNQALTHKQLKNFLDHFGSQVNNKCLTTLFLTGQPPDINSLHDIKVLKELIIG